MAKRSMNRLPDFGKGKWAVIAEAVNGGWGPTLRLIAIRAAPLVCVAVVSVAGFLLRIILME